MARSEKAASRIGLLLALAAPLLVVLWVVAQASGLALGFWPTVVLIPLVMLAVTLAQGPVEVYLATCGPSQVPRGLVPFTLGYLAFHAERACWPLPVMVLTVLGPVVLLGLAWAGFMILAFV